MKFDENNIHQYGNLDLLSNQIVEGFITGLHKSPYHGFSVEFSEHRPYGFGDEIKYIDWKLWGKTDRFYIKQFEEETNLKCHIILDKSSSMNFGSKNITKFEYSKLISAAMSYLMIKQQDAVGLTTFDQRINTIIKPKSKVNHLNLLLKTLHNSNTGGETNISNLLHGLAESINKKGLIILISDLLDDEKRVMESLRHFRYRGHEIIVFHIVDPKEKNLDYNENINFIDLENNYNIVADSRLVKDKYNKAFRNFSDFYKKECLRDKIDYNLISTSDSLDKTLLQYLIRRSQINK